MKNLQIRHAKSADILNIALLKQQVWISTYAEEGIRSEFSDYVFSAFTPENTERLLSKEHYSIILAEVNNHLIGCIETDYNAVCPVFPNERIPEITVLYVLEKFQGKGIGSKLLETASREIEDSGLNKYWLTVYEKNRSAINYYRHKGLKKIGVTYFSMGENNYPNDILIKTPD